MRQKMYTINKKNSLGTKKRVPSTAIILNFQGIPCVTNQNNAYHTQKKIRTTDTEKYITFLWYTYHSFLYFQGHQFNYLGSQLQEGYIPNFLKVNFFAMFSLFSGSWETQLQLNKIGASGHQSNLRFKQGKQNYEDSKFFHRIS